ncbi:molybdopterin-containing oxidoreductase family protein [Aliamphritea hakodatensis]|uniref:molybdopterin-containing oxidoreductase family protein n=1 Tax=Aliamphritea hakodatensis TaxID=2895352 RepID=UPI0022FD9019|nr:molybdopterin-dependent oxidoreductase [Aliamphritea hakodatensis]
MTSPTQSSTPQVQEKLSVCPLDCPDTCSLKVTVADNKITKIRGSQVNPLTEGSICTKVARYYPDFVHGPRRLRHPLLRTGPRGSGQYRQISWDEALDRVHQRLSQAIENHGSSSVLPFNYAGPHGKLSGGSMDVRFFKKLGGTRLNRGPLCGGVRSLSYRSLYGNSSPGMPPQQAEFADLILIWGCNVSVANLHFMRTIKRARKRGAKLVVIDPHRTQVARQADLYLQVTPGSDVSLALYLTARLAAAGKIDTSRLTELTTGLDAYLEHAAGYLDTDLESICGVSPDTVEQLTALLTTAESITVNVGVGLERTRNGGAACRAAYSFPLLFGTLGKAGNGVIGSYGPLFPGNTQLTDVPENNAAAQREFNIIDVSDHLLDAGSNAPVKAVFIYNHNPVATHPDQQKMIRALSNEDLFIVGCDVEMNDSMQYADVILPAATHFEHQDAYSAYGHGYLQRAEPVIAPVGEALPNTEIFRRLAARFGFTDAEFRASDEDLLDQAFSLNREQHGISSVRKLPTDQAMSMQEADFRWLNNRTLTTPSQKAELYSDTLQNGYQAGLPEYTPIHGNAAYQLLSPASDKRTNATFGGNTASDGLQILELNPADAEQLKVTDGAPLIISNQLGEVKVQAKLTDAVAKGIVLVDKGAWCHTSSTGLTVNALISNRSRTDIGDGAAYYDTFVDIRKA